MLQRVNPLVPNKLQNINRRIHPSEQQKKESISTFETASLMISILNILLIANCFSNVEIIYCCAVSHP